jgi:hypothetical protein
MNVPIEPPLYWYEEEEEEEEEEVARSKKYIEMLGLLSLSYINQQFFFQKLFKK